MRTLFHTWLHLPFPLWNSAAGASIPGFFAAFAMYVMLRPLTRRRGRARAAERP